MFPQSAPSFCDDVVFGSTLLQIIVLSWFRSGPKNRELKTELEPKKSSSKPNRSSKITE